MPRKGSIINDLSGRAFGRWTVLGFSHRNGRTAQWLCVCACGTQCTVGSSNLLSGGSRSCGCLRSEMNASAWTTHGHSACNSPEYESWCAMWARVRSKSGRRFQDYGSRGITACARWEDFAAFLADMGQRPAGMSLDRINNDGNYEPTNCRWATNHQQRMNQRPHKRARSSKEESTQ